MWFILSLTGLICGAAASERLELHASSGAIVPAETVEVSAARSLHKVAEDAARMSYDDQSVAADEALYYEDIARQLRGGKLRAGGMRGRLARRPFRRTVMFRRRRFCPCRLRRCCFLRRCRFHPFCRFRGLRVDIEEEEDFAEL